MTASSKKAKNTASSLEISRKRSVIANKKKNGKKDNEIEKFKPPRTFCSMQVPIYKGTIVFPEH